MTFARYARQMVLPELGTLGQERLAQARVLIVGVGGLGSPVALYLAAAGVGSIGLVDPDQVELSNLQRQILYETGDQGRKKVTSAATRLQALNPDLHVAVYPKSFNAANALAIASGYDVIVDGSDNLACKYLLNDVAIRLQRPFVYGSILKWQGQVSVFWAKHGPCYRCLFPVFPKFAVQNCAEAGVMGALAGLVGSIQALETIKLLIADPKDMASYQNQSLLGKLLQVDAKTMISKQFHLAQEEQCPSCQGLASEHDLQDYGGQLCAAEIGEAIREVSVLELEAHESWRDFQAIDVREAEEWQQGHLPDAWNWPLSMLEEGSLPSSSKHLSHKPLLVYCQSGRRSRRALALLQTKGFESLFHLTQGFSAWQGPVSTP